MAADAKKPARGVSLNQIEVVAEALNKVSDDLNAALQQIQERLVSFNVGLDVYVELRPDTFYYPDPDPGQFLEADKPTRVQTQLGFARHSSHWCLVVRTVVHVEDGDKSRMMSDSSQMLLQASRRDRLRAVQHIPDLLQAILDTANAAVERIAVARTLTDSLYEEDAPF